MMKDLMKIPDLCRIRKDCISLSNHLEQPISISMHLIGHFLPELLISVLTSYQELRSLLNEIA